MTLLPRARHVEERMDRPDVDRAELETALRDVARVNRWLGARRALLRYLPDLLPPSPRPLRVLDVGTGSADLPLAIADWAARHGRALEIAAIDMHAGTLRHARSRIARRARTDDPAHTTRTDGPPVRLVRGDALRLPFRTGAFDLALLSMTLHHMDGPALTGSLRELGRVARGGNVLVGELERSLPHWLGARLLAATLWRSHPVTRHDGPLSVLRAFTPDEMRSLARDAGLRNPSVRRHLLYRLVLRAEA